MRLAREEEEMKDGHPSGPAKSTSTATTTTTTTTTTRPLSAQIPQAVPAPGPANTTAAAGGGGVTAVCFCPCAAYQSEVLKRYSTGLKSVMFKPTKHAIQVTEGTEQISQHKHNCSYFTLS